ncbi:hypothetical protein ACFFUB_06465 [Algimonas porphyrae]|uniref:Lipoprotein n=1 Tax=Algimonas porphyrae TaxID=1128113 RepID=A0ABQ5V2K5_9PROT|nr:hypothetical protein [Algimonas porphyrae]GLQ21197.1 hypothetical protein GCM10007854_21520 [Algimonas porphyrae]
MIKKPFIATLIMGLLTTACFASTTSDTAPDNQDTNSKSGDFIVSSGPSIKMTPSTRLTKLSETFYCEGNRVDLDMTMRYDADRNADFQTFDLNIKYNGEVVDTIDIERKVLDVLKLSNVGFDMICANNSLAIDVLIYDTIPNPRHQKVNTIYINLSSGSLMPGIYGQ